MRLLVGIDDTDSSRGLCTTYLAYRIACDLRKEVRVVPYPRLVRLNPNIPFKTRGNAAVCLKAEVRDAALAFELLERKLESLSDVEGGANSGMVFLEDLGLAPEFRPIYLAALTGVVSPARVRRFLESRGVRYHTLGNGMGIVGAAASIAFDQSADHTFELVSYRKKSAWGSPRALDKSSVFELDRLTHPHTFNNCDYQKRKSLVSPHGPDPVFAGIRGDSPGAVIRAFRMLRVGEELDGHMVYISNQHTDAHLAGHLDWKVYSSGWMEVVVEHVETGPGGHVYATVREDGGERVCAFYEPTGDLRRAARRLGRGDVVRLSGGVRRATSKHKKILNVEKMEVLSLGPGGATRGLMRGVFIASPRANRHLTKPLVRYGREGEAGDAIEVPGWVEGSATEMRALARSR